MPLHRQHRLPFVVVEQAFDVPRAGRSLRGTAQIDSERNQKARGDGRSRGIGPSRQVAKGADRSRCVAAMNRPHEIA